MVRKQGTLGDVIPASMLQLVDVAGNPIQAPTPRQPAESWPRWADIVSARLGAKDDEMERYGLSVTFGDALNKVLFTAERCQAEPDDFDVDAGSPPIPDPLPDSFPVVLGGLVSPDLEDIADSLDTLPTEPLDGPDAPDDGLHVRFPGIASLAERLGIRPIAGGSPEHTYTDDDAADYSAWMDQTYPAAPDDQAEPVILPLPIDRHSPAALARINLALYGRSEPFHA